MEGPTAVAGITARIGGEPLEIEDKATILTTGGFSTNREMLVKDIGPHADHCKLRGSSSDTGDGLKMALEIGIKTVNLKYFYGHLLSLKSPYDDRVWPYPRLDSLVDEGILANRSGHRFVDERRGDVAAANELVRINDVRGACLIFDEEAWEGARNDPQSVVAMIPSANLWLMENDGNLYKRDTAEELAEVLTIDGRNLARTVENLNHAIKSGSLNGLQTARTGTMRPLSALFYGLKVVPGITFTM